jgi:hypothetical protein
VDCGQPGSTERAAWIYEELKRTEGHLTSQLQNQQARIATTLTVAGVMLSFLATNAFSSARIHMAAWQTGLFFGSMGLLGLSMLAGVAALRPRVSRSDPRFLDTDWLRNQGTSSPTELYGALNSSFDVGRIRITLDRRRSLQRFQLGLLAVGSSLLVLTIAVVA